MFKALLLVSVTPKTNVHVQIEQCLMCIEVHNIDTHHQLKIGGSAWDLGVFEWKNCFCSQHKCNIRPIQTNSANL